MKAIPRLALHWQILIALAIAILLGIIAKPDVHIFGISLLSLLGFFGTLFLNALKMLIVPLVVASIITGMMELKPDSLGRLGSKTLVFYASSSLVAILIGLLMVNLLQPGLVDDQPALARMSLSSDTESVLAKVEGKGAGDIAEVFLRMVPANIVSAAAEGQMLGLIFFSLLFGYFLSRLKGQHGTVQKDFWQGLLSIMMQMTNLVMKFAPLGVFALVCKVVMQSGVDAFMPLAVFFTTVIVALSLHLFIFLPLVLKFIARVNPVLHFKAMMPALLTAFS
ncbi:MAG: dicarboxylate/amino acid:cation symporter, partial [Gammaproteobacteria bacterium]|nr:dicarboxylate/amino acid:cation symporter [Gammaproteobacteria bacterium]